VSVAAAVVAQLVRVQLALQELVEQVAQVLHHLLLAHP
jgi:hypothetical protein